MRQDRPCQMCGHMSAQVGCRLQRVVAAWLLRLHASLGILAATTNLSCHTHFTLKAPSDCRSPCTSPTGTYRGTRPEAWKALQSHCRMLFGGLG